MHQKFYLYIKSLSDLGTMMDMIVLNTIVWNATHSTFWLSAVLGIRVFGGLLASLFAGVLADRYNRKKAMIASDIVRAVLILILIPFPNPTMILIISFVVGIMSTYFVVNFSAEVPRIFGEDRVLETNALLSRLRSISMVAGFLGAGIASKWVGNQIVLGIDSLTYILSAIVLFRLKWDLQPVQATTSTPRTINATVRTFFDDLREILAYLKSKPLLYVVFILFLVDTFGASSHNLGIPLLASQLDPTSSFYYGLILGVWALGNIVSTWILPKLHWVKQRLYPTLTISMLLMSAGFITLLSSTTLPMILPFAFVTGIFDAAAVTLYSTLMQQSDNSIRGRIFGVSSMVTSFGFGVGFIVAPLVLQVVSMPHMVWMFHGLVIASVIAAYLVTLNFKRAPQLL